MSVIDPNELSLLVLAPSRVLSRVLQHELNVLGYKNIMLAHTMEQAKDSLVEQKISALISSMYFEDGDIFELINQVKEEQNTMPFKLLLVSSEQREEKINRAIQAGAVAVLTRPFKAEELEHYLHDMALADN